MTFKHGVIATLLTILIVGGILTSIDSLEKRIELIEGEKT